MPWRPTPASLRRARRQPAAGGVAGGLPAVRYGGAGVCPGLQHGGEYIIALLTSLPSLQQLADRYLIWQTILPVVGVWCYLLDGMFIGATRGAEMRNSMAVAAAGFAVTLLTVPALGNHGLWLALAVFLALRGLSLALIWRRHWRRGTGLVSPF